MLLIQGPHFKNHHCIPAILIQNKTKAALEMEFEQTEIGIWLKLMREVKEPMFLEIVNQDKNNYSIKSVGAYSALDSVLALSVLYVRLNTHESVPSVL